MDRKEQLRRRRQQRIRHILSGEEEREYGLEPWRAEWLELDRDPRLQEDPEYQWYVKGNPWRRSSKAEGTIRFQVIASVVAFAAVWAMFQWNHPSVEQGQAFVRSALTEELQFDAMYAWYEERFGPVPSFIPALDRDEAGAARVNAPVSRSYITPVAGSIVEPFGGARSGTGIVIQATNSVVSSMETGLVIYAGETQETGRTVVIRHPGGVETVYGYLGEIRVAKDDWVKAGSAIALVTPADGRNKGGLVYFAVKKGNSFIDPADVVAL
jgi:stage IV sporulation protein FA